MTTFYNLSTGIWPFLKTGANWLGLALQVGTVRYLDFCPDDLATPPGTLMTYLAGQLNLRPNVLAGYGQRSQTRTEALQEVMAYPRFCLAKPGDLDALRPGWSNGP